MRILLSVAARNRKFSEAMDRIDTVFHPLFNEFEKIVWKAPLFQAILLGVTDDCPEGLYDEDIDGNGNLDLNYGIVLPESDDKLSEIVYGILYDATLKCGFADPDQEKVDALFAEYSLEKLRELSKLN